MDSNAAKTKAQFSYNRKQVCFLCGITDTEFGHFQMDTARAFLEKNRNMVSDIDAVFISSVFQAWWCYHWNLIDDRNVLRDIYTIKPGQRYSWYRQMHQYVFDESSNHREQLMLDFVDMRSSIESDIKAVEV